MTSKLYKTLKNKLIIVNESATAYQRQPSTVEITSSNQWNPNIPFHGTQEEWWEHIHQIEAGEFITWEEHQKKFSAWKKQYLENLM